MDDAKKRQRNDTALQFMKIRDILTQWTFQRHARKQMEKKLEFDTIDGILRFPILDFLLRSNRRLQFLTRGVSLESNTK